MRGGGGWRMKVMLLSCLICAEERFWLPWHATENFIKGSSMVPHANWLFQNRPCNWPIGA
ncbi:hypothetical protein A2U01_0101375, partial [Trifolium medium]|nr:hypothetical protein [Trifolium medium]